MRGLTKAGRLVTYVALPVALLVFWWVASAGSESYFFPPLKNIVSVMPDTWLTGRFVEDVIPSLVRLTIGYLAAVILGVVLGIIIGSWRVARLITEPVYEFLRAIPPPVLIPILILFAGIGDLMKVSVILVSCTWPVLLNTVEGVRSVDEVLRDAAKCFRLRRLTIVRRLILRGASPQIAVGARQSLSLGIILMVISEMFAASNGLGFAIIQFQNTYAIPEMWSGILLLGVIGVVLAAIFRVIELRMLRWYEGLRQAQRRDA